MRRTFNGASATPLGIVTYDPWGTPESGSVPTFGFTGELQDTTAGLVNLRARWYSTSQGKLTTVDPFEGSTEEPYSLHPTSNYAGLTPLPRESGTSVRGRAQLGRDGNARLRTALYRATINAARFNPIIKALLGRPAIAVQYQ